jgi:tRNA threonylcarbamoyladenosine biosynthesis protein TsaB
MVICLETSTNICSVALCNSFGVVAVRESSENKSHASQLTVFIQELLAQEDLRASDLDAVAVSKGPGSYTGLRIGVSTAKGIAYAASIPLIGVETALSMFYGIDETIKRKYGTDETSLFVPMIDARRMIVKGISAEIIDDRSFGDIPESVRLLIFGDGASKCKQVIKRGNVGFADEFRMSAGYMYEPVYKSLREKRFEDIAYFEPFYLKDFITSRPKKNILGR